MKTYIKAFYNWPQTAGWPNS